MIDHLAWSEWIIMDDGWMDGGCRPPFSVTAAAVRDLYGAHFHIDEVRRAESKAFPDTIEVVHMMTRR